MQTILFEETIVISTDLHAKYFLETQEQFRSEQSLFKSHIYLFKKDTKKNEDSKAKYERKEMLNRKKRIPKIHCTRMIHGKSVL